MEPGYLSRYMEKAVDWITEESWLDIRQRERIFLFPISSRPPVGHAQLLI
jgi:hypothetical protein